MKILILTLFFPPQNSIASWRPYSWAKYWSRLGHDVTVVTVVKKKLPENSPVPCTDFKVKEVPIPGRDLIRKIITHSKNTHNTNLQTKNAYAYKKNKIRKILYNFRKSTGCFYSCRFPDLLDGWAVKIIQMLKNSHWDLVVSTAGPYSVHFPAYYLKKSSLTRIWVADWRDLWVDNHIFPGFSFFRYFEKYLEKKFCLRADVVTTVSEPLAKTLSQKYKRDVQVIYNGFDPDDFDYIKVNTHKPNEKSIKKIVYTGTIYSPYTDPTPLFRAIRSLANEGRVIPEKLRIIFCGSNADVTKLAEVEGVKEFVEYKGLIPRADALKMQRNADALLFLEFESEKLKGILTGKLFEYLYANTPILAVGIDNESGAGNLIVETGSGRCCGRNISAIKQAIIDILAGKKLASNMVDPKKREEILEKFSRKNQAERMLELVAPFL